MHKIVGLVEIAAGDGERAFRQMGVAERAAEEPSQQYASGCVGSVRSGRLEVQERRLQQPVRLEKDGPAAKPRHLHRHRRSARPKHAGAPDDGHQAGRFLADVELRGLDPGRVDAPRLAAFEGRVGGEQQGRFHPSRADDRAGDHRPAVAGDPQIVQLRLAGPRRGRSWNPGVEIETVERGGGQIMGEPEDAGEGRAARGDIEDLDPMGVAVVARGLGPLDPARPVIAAEGIAYRCFDLQRGTGQAQPRHQAGAPGDAAVIPTPAGIDAAGDEDCCPRPDDRGAQRQSGAKRAAGHHPAAAIRQRRVDMRHQPLPPDLGRIDRALLELGERALVGAVAEQGEAVRNGDDVEQTAAGLQPPRLEQLAVEREAEQLGRCPIFGLGRGRRGRDQKLLGSLGMAQQARAGTCRHVDDRPRPQELAVAVDAHDGMARRALHRRQQEEAVGKLDGVDEIDPGGRVPEGTGPDRRPVGLDQSGEADLPVSVGAYGQIAAAGDRNRLPEPARRSGRIAIHERHIDAPQGLAKVSVRTVWAMVMPSRANSENATEMSAVGIGPPAIIMKAWQQSFEVSTWASPRSAPA